MLEVVRIHLDFRHVRDHVEAAVVIFVGTAIAWLAANSAALNNGWSGMRNWEYWVYFHGFVFFTSLAIAIVLTLYSLFVYLNEWRKLTPPPPQ